MLLRFTLILALLTSIGIFEIAPAARAQQTATLRCRLNQTELTAGDETDLFVDILNVEGLYGYQLELIYLTDQIQVQDRDPDESGINLETDSFFDNFNVIKNQADNTTGHAELAVFQLAPSEPQDGSGLLATATILGNNPGPASFSFENVVLSDADGNTIPHEVQDCSIDVTVFNPGPGPATCYDFDAEVQPGIDDVQAVANLWGAPGDYDITYDVAPAGSPDGEIDIRDIMEVVTELGNPCE